MRRALLTGGAAAVLLTAALATPAAAAQADDNATACTKAASTIKTGAGEFATDAQNAANQFKAGDAAAADQSAKQAGARLVTMGGDLNTQAAQAQDGAAKTAITTLANDFVAAGTSVTSLASLAKVDGSKLESDGAAFAKACNITATPTESIPGAPSSGDGSGDSPAPSSTD
jgi:hypothetical protein